MIRRPPRSTLVKSSAASDVYKRQALDEHRKIVEIVKNNKIDKSYFIGTDFFNSHDNTESLFFYKTKENFYDDVNKINEKQILIKGSRAMKMEEIINKKLK